MNLAQSISLVTGAGRGIGRAIALAMAKEGATVLLTARTVPELEAVRREIETGGGKAVAMPADVTSDDQLHALFDAIEKRFKRLDLLVNNAGIGRFAPFTSLSVADLDSMWKLNVRAVFLCSQRAVRLMEVQKGGAIINISSLAGKNSFAGGSGYSATKWALMGFSKTLMLEVREHNIRVITVCPGSVDTTFSTLQKDSLRSEKILHPADVAETVLAAIRLPDRAMVSEIDIRPTNPK
ncbi:MAG TPA: short-chain dehydrogenase [Bacteroidetes bacterium]|nr:short-chain dehydrogenase [Bacteroidota bacterium]